MNLEQKEKSGFSLSFAAITVAISAAALFLFAVSFAFLLSKMDHFENYYQPIVWLILALVGIVIALISRKNPDFAVLNAAISSAVLSVLRFGIGLIVNRSGTEGILQILIESVVLVVISIVTTILLAAGKKKRKTSPGKFRFGSK